MRCAGRCDARGGGWSSCGRRRLRGRRSGNVASLLTGGMVPVLESVPVSEGGAAVGSTASARPCCCSRPRNAAGAWTRSTDKAVEIAVRALSARWRHATRGSGSGATRCGPTAGSSASRACGPWPRRRPAIRSPRPAPPRPTPSSTPPSGPASTPTATGGTPPTTRPWTPPCCCPPTRCPARRRSAHPGPPSPRVVGNWPWCARNRGGRGTVRRGDIAWCQLRGNLPQAFVPTLLLEAAARLGE